MKTKFQSKMFLLVVCFFFGNGVAHFGWAQKAVQMKDPSPLKKFKLQERNLKSSRGVMERFYALGETAKLATEAGEFRKAQFYATELLQAAPKYRLDWNYGNAIHDGHMVLGRVALAKGDKKAAIKHLLEAGKTPGSPQLDSFGPNMLLARDLIARGEKKAVLAYFVECKSFWKMENGRLDSWKREVEKGRTPNFGPNLLY